VRLLKDHDNPRPEETHHLDTDTMRLVSDELRRSREPAELLHASLGRRDGRRSGVRGNGRALRRARSYFFVRRNDTAPQPGLVELTDEELERGGVHETYIQPSSTARSRRGFGAWKSIWHQADRGEVFVVGESGDHGEGRDRLGRGARHFRKPLYVFDQVKNAWFQWKNDAWEPSSPPRIQRTRFCGTGTRLT
jgi:hypothetical protein